MRPSPVSLGIAVAAALGADLPAQAGRPVLEPMYASDATVFMSAPRAVAAGGIRTTQDFYIVAYSFAPRDGPIATAMAITRYATRAFSTVRQYRHIARSS